MTFRPWILMTSSSGETFRALFRALPEEARRAYRGAFTDRACPAADVAREVAPAAFVNECSKQDIEARTLEWVRKEGFAPEGAVLMCGYFRIVSGAFLEALSVPVFNTHPSLLPSFPGLDQKVHMAAFEESPISGFSFHMVTDRLDGGPVLFEHPVWVADAASADEMRSRVRAAEQKWLPRVWLRALGSAITAADRHLSGRALRARYDFALKSFDDVELR